MSVRFASYLDGTGFTIATTAEDIERVDSVLYYRTMYMESNKAKMKEMFRLRNPPVPMAYLEPVIEKNVAKNWGNLYQEIMAEKFPDLLFSTLKTDNKKYQQKFLRGMQFTPLQLAAFYFKAYQKLGFTFSSYSTEHLPKGTDIQDMPVLVHVDKNSLTKVGETTLSDGELKQVVTQRSAIYGKILDKEDKWHCFFTTIESIAAKENWKEGQPHYHYISDKFGVSREEVVKQLKNKDYRLFNLPYLELNQYRDKDKSGEADL